MEKQDHSKRENSIVTLSEKRGTYNPAHSLLLDLKNSGPQDLVGQKLNLNYLRQSRRNTYDFPSAKLPPFPFYGEYFQGFSLAKGGPSDHLFRPRLIRCSCRITEE